MVKPIYYVHIVNVESFFTFSSIYFLYFEVLNENSNVVTTFSFIYFLYFELVNENSNSGPWDDEQTAEIESWSCQTTIFDDNYKR